VSNGDVTLRLFGPLRTAVGSSHLKLRCAGTTLTEALTRFAQRHTDAARQFIFDERGNRRPSMILLVNGDTVADTDAVRLQEGDEIAILLPLAGG
jgi:molybdopterin converting factor small subunit